MQQYLFLDNIYIYFFLTVWLPFPILLSFSYHPKMMRSSYLEIFCYVMQINLPFFPSGSITSHKWFTSLKAKGLTSLRTCFKFDIVVDKFLIGWALESILSA